MKRDLPKIDSLGDLCCGCGACAAKCTKACVAMTSDAYGFLQPEIDFDVCAGCGACDAACPALCGRPEDGFESAIWAKSDNRTERSLSSSGGIFALLAHEVLSDGGIVCGAAWAPDFKSVQHILVNSEDGLDAIMRSKYVQSVVGRGAYEGIRSALKEGKRALFVGTACQVSGMRGYLGKLADSDNFLAIDVICHGVPSPLLWKKWAEWREARVGASLRDVNMRSKTTGWLSYSAVYTYTAE